MAAPWTREAVEALGPTTDVPTAAAIFGVNPDTVYGAIRRGEWTATRVLRLGRVIKIPTLDLITLLYAPEADPAPATGAIPAVPSQCQHPETAQVAAAIPHSQCGCMSASAGAVRSLRSAT